MVRLSRSKTPPVHKPCLCPSPFKKWQKIVILLVVVVAQCSFEPVAESVPIVRVESGLIAGTTLTVGNESVDAFLGIPYAEPPVGNLRFRKPLPVTPWNGTYGAAKKPRPCWQTTLRFIPEAPLNYYSTASEDCLYLNVWKRSSTCSGSSMCSDKRPVVVFIHGGGFQWGDSALFVYDAANFVALSDVVFVTFNYRVSIFGFLSLGSPELPGNFGLWDQNLALKWVRENIEKFGGDSDDVTLMGQSAGAMSLALQAVTPKHQGIFKKAVLMSATPFSMILGFSYRGVGKFIQVAGALGCFDGKKSLEEQLDDVMSCLRKLEPAFMVRTVETLDQSKQVFVPEYGDEFFPDNPLAEKTWERMPFEKVVIGTTLDEGTLLFDNLQYASPSLKSILATDYRLAMTVALYPLFGISLPEARRIVETYFGGPEVQHTPESVTKVASELLGDAVAHCPAKLFADITAQQGIGTYRYLFAHRGTHSFWPKWMGVVHSDDIMYALGSLPTIKDKNQYIEAMGDKGREEIRKLNYTPKEEIFMQQIVSMLSSFVTSGKPVLPVPGKEWPQYTKDDPKLLLFQPGNFTEVLEKKSKLCELWRPHVIK